MIEKIRNTPSDLTFFVVFASRQKVQHPPSLPDGREKSALHDKNLPKNFGLGSSKLSELIPIAIGIATLRIPTLSERSEIRESP
jgi:hypothetical protein